MGDGCLGVGFRTGKAAGVGIAGFGVGSLLDDAVLIGGEETGRGLAGSGDWTGVFGLFAFVFVRTGGLSALEMIGLLGSRDTFESGTTL